MIQLMREQLRIFPYTQYIVRIYVSLAFQKYAQVQGRCWSLQVICKNITVTSGTDHLKQQRKRQGFTHCIMG